MKKILSFIITISMLVGVSYSAFAYAVKDIPKDEKINAEDLSSYKLVEDFSSVKEGGRPDSILSYTVPGSAEIKVVSGINEEGKNKNLLLIDDKNSLENVSYDVPVNQSSSKVLFETKFKYVKTTDDFMSFTFDLYSGKTMIGRVIQYTNGKNIYTYSNAGVNTAMTPDRPESDAWYTLQILFDKNSGLFDVQLQSESMKNKKGVSARYDAVTGVSMLKGTPVYTGHSGKPLTSINVRTTAKRGQLYFDWIRLKENVSELEYKGIVPPPLKLPMTVAPVYLSSDDKIDVSVNGEYLFFTYPVFEENGEVYIPLLSIPSAFGLKATVDNSICSLDKEGTNIKVDLVSGKISINDKQLEKDLLIKDKVHYIPLLAFAKTLGNDVVYENDVIITGKE